MLVSLLAVSWFSIDWTDEGTDVYPGGIVLRDDAGNVLRVSLGVGDTDCRPYYTADPNDWIVKALVAAEDGTYWTHHGVRPLSILRAAAQNLIYRRRISGASTLTMQAVRLIKPHPKTFFGKFKEAIRAVKMERAKDKRWILSQYLNRAPFGSNFIGIEAAAHGWFGKSAKELGLAEAAMLAGMVQAPSRFRPDRGFERAFKRRDYVLSRMRTLGMIDDDQFEAAHSIRPVICRSPRPFKAPYFCDWYLHKLNKDHAAQRLSGDIKTSLNADLQTLAESAVARASEEGGYSVALVIEAVSTGAVKAMACSGNYFDTVNGQVNTALAPRPAGSTLKPFLTALAMDCGLVTPETRLLDVPKAYKGYHPVNFDASYRGSVSTRDALVLSLNIPFVCLLQRLGISAFGENLRSLGFSHMPASDDDLGLGMAIGNVNVSLVELVSAYATLARGGVTTTGVRVYSSGSSYLISDMLSGNERSEAAFGHVADVALPRFAWKTGTSAAYRDAWTVAWNPEYVIGVWCGHKYGGFGDTSLVGAKAAAPIALQVARALYPQNEGPWFVAPGSVQRRPVCALTGAPLGPNCPEQAEGRFVVGQSGNQPCAVHVRAADGTLQLRDDPTLLAFSGLIQEAEKLQISKPENDSVFCLVPGFKQQRIVCQVVGNPASSHLWWLVDGVMAGETLGLAPFVTDMTVGSHTVTCTTALGITSSVSFMVKEN